MNVNASPKWASYTASIICGCIAVGLTIVSIERILDGVSFSEFGLRVCAPIVVIGLFARQAWSIWPSANSNQESI